MHVIGVFEQHFAVADDMVERRAQFVARFGWPESWVLLALFRRTRFARCRLRRVLLPRFDVTLFIAHRRIALAKILSIFSNSRGKSIGFVS